MIRAALIIFFALFCQGLELPSQPTDQNQPKQDPDFVVQIQRKGKGPLYSSKTIVDNTPKQATRPMICVLQNYVYSEPQQNFYIRANKAFNVSVNSDNPIVSVNGIGVSMGSGSQYSTQMIIMTRCRHLQLSMPSFNLTFKFQLGPHKNTILVPMTMQCSSDISNTKIEYVLLQFIVSAIFVLCSFIFTKFVFTSYNIDTLLCSLLCISWAHQMLAIILAVTLTGRILYSLCAIHPGARYRRLMFTYSFSFVIHLLIRFLEVEVPILHLLLNFLMVVGLITIIKITRLRHLLYIWIVIMISYKAFAQQTSRFYDYQMYFPALFPNSSYACVSNNVMELALPLCFSLFFTRFSKQSSSARNIYLMMHFIVFLTVGTLGSIMEMKNKPLQQPLLYTLAGIVVVSFIVAIAEGNFRRLVQYRVQI